jgi:2-polyprenyl-3-methyl-5-hydroxy-6-metoxy-1,4-benzoquinol methylase
LDVAINDLHACEMVNEREREAGLKALRLENFKVIVDLAGRFVPADGRKLLDVGSAHGWFLETARDRFDVLGIEPDAVVGARAAARGLPVRSGFFPEALQDGECFDVIVFNDVIEHIPNIHAALAACEQRLKPGGILILNVPSSRGFFYRLSKLMARAGCRAPFDRLWQKGLPSPHVHYFDPNNLSRLVTAHQFEQVHSAQLPSLRSEGLLERLRCVGKMSPLSLYVQYAAIRCAIPLLRFFPSDTIVGIFRKKTAA